MITRVLRAVIFAAILLTVGTAAVGWWGWQEMQKPLPVAAAGMVYEVPPGTSLRQVSRELESLGVLPNAWFLEIWGRWIEPGEPIKTGEYRLEPGSTLSELLAQLRAGKVIRYPLRVIEGTRFRDVVASLEGLIAEGRLTREIAAEHYDAAFQQFSGQESAEGWVVPDTYFVTKDQSNLGFLKHAYSQTRELLDRAWARRAKGLPLASPYEALILASIVEKETGLAEERPLIAGVFINRLKKGMRLQTDPTVIYGMGERYHGNITKKDLKTDTLYNTYTRKGLPPTPIAMPGRAAIEAVLNPEQTDALYFVAKGGGAHHFSRTYKEHRQAVIKYLLGGNAKRYTGDQ